MRGTECSHNRITLITSIITSTITTIPPPITSTPIIRALPTACASQEILTMSKSASAKMNFPNWNNVLRVEYVFLLSSTSNTSDSFNTCPIMGPYSTSRTGTTPLSHQLSSSHYSPTSSSIPIISPHLPFPIRLSLVVKSKRTSA